MASTSFKLLESVEDDKAEGETDVTVSVRLESYSTESEEADSEAVRGFCKNEVERSGFQLRTDDKTTATGAIARQETVIQMIECGKRFISC